MEHKPMAPRSLKTLVVEDNETSRVLLVGLLSRYGTVEAVDRSAVALESVLASLARRQPFDLICLDIILDGINGQQLLKVIRHAEEDAGYSLGQGAKIVMTTALRDTSSIMGAFRSTCDGYLPKPIDTEKLDEMLRELALIP
jgi:two-component system chemotaxis response regulator CheY